MTKQRRNKHIKRKPLIDDIANHRHFKARKRRVLPVDTFKATFFTYFDLIGGIRQQTMYYRAIWCYGLRKLCGAALHGTGEYSQFKEAYFYDYMFYARSCMLKYRKEYDPAFVSDWREFRDFALRLAPVKSNAERKRKYNAKKRKERLKQTAHAARSLATYHRNKGKKGQSGVNEAP